MKNLFVFILLMAFISGTRTATARSWEEITKSGTLLVGVPGDYAPLAFYDKEGKLSGFDIDMSILLADQLHLNIVFIPVSWTALPDSLAADRFDIAMGGVTETQERKSRFALSAPILKNGKIALTQCDNTSVFQTLKSIDQKGVRVIVNPGGTNQRYVEKTVKHAEIILARNNIASLQAIRDRRADVMFTDWIEGHYYETQEPGVFCVATQGFLPDTVGYKVYMVTNNNQYLLQSINRILSGSEKEKLAKKWNLVTAVTK